MDEILWARQVATPTTASASTTSSPQAANLETALPSSPGANPTSSLANTPGNSEAALPSSSVVNPTSNSESSSVADATSSFFATSALQSSSSSESSSVATASSTSDIQHPSSGLSDGGLAGAIVGSILGTFIFTLLGAFLFFRRGRQNKSHSERTLVTSPDITKGLEQTYSHPIQSSLLSTNGTQASHSVPVGAQYLNLSAYIPQPADDGTVSSRIQTLFDQASLHVDNYYSTRLTKLELSQDVTHSIEHYDSTFLPAPLTTMLSNSRAKRSVLTHVLVRKLLQAIQPGNEPECLLPVLYASGPRLTPDNGDDRAIFAWRMLTAYLHRAGGPGQETIPIDPPEDAIRSFAEDFTSTFAPYSDSQFPDSDRFAHLTRVFRAASDLGAWLFSQPCTFDFRWDTSSTPPGQTVVLPAVVKVSDELGQRLLAPQTLVERTVARI
ncbi:hypothetical protein BDV38DRAFT_237620 [Aspergillus pseudotamarii]|uniref:Uncharacterized protein n=1 Tax=Aspergillus pseudotamarii TaxID=132259 RepID=A0A5N6T4M7_ASPPS|nr:uncharacterized protein BDV38DRAFT_237620 [Aspergillus pseudotamarii]KAE8141240.1 hypothetical protein BDV38DRAFT_237620 [Aspergillus pseudotamarii]